MYQNVECLILLLFIHQMQMFCYFVWLIIIVVSSIVQHVLFSVRLAWDPGSKIYNVSVNPRAIDLNTCQALPFFHALTGCDTVSNFFKPEQEEYVVNLA